MTRTFGDQSTSVIERFLDQRSSQKAQILLTRFLSESSLSGSMGFKIAVKKRLHTLRSQLPLYNHGYSHNYRSMLSEQSLMIAQQNSRIQER